MNILRLGGAIFPTLAILASVQALALQPLRPERQPITVSVSWKPTSPTQPCRFTAKNTGPIKYVEKRLDQIVIQQFVNKDDGSLAWSCVVPVKAAASVIRQGGPEFLLENYFSWSGVSLFTEYRGPTKTRLYRAAHGQTSYADVDGPTASQSTNVTFAPNKKGDQSTAYLVFDQTGAKGGIYVLPVPEQRSMKTSMTLSPDADFLENSDGKLIDRKSVV